MPSRVISKRVGSGMTAHTDRRTEYDWTQPLTKEEAAEVSSFFANVRPYDPIGRVRGLAERTLQAIADGLSDPHDFEPRVGMGWYSREIIKHCNWIEKARARGDDPSRFVELGYEIGSLITEALLKKAWDQDVEAAQKAEEAHKRGGENARRKHPDSRYLERYRHFRAQGLGKSDATDQAAQELGVSKGTIRNARKRADASD